MESNSERIARLEEQIAMMNKSVKILEDEASKFVTRTELLTASIAISTLITLSITVLKNFLN